MTYGSGPAGAFNGFIKQVINSGPFDSAQPGYVGKFFSSPRALSRAVVYGPCDRGYANTGVAQPVTLSLYGRVGAPANSADGTLLASMTFTQNPANEFVPRTLASSDQVTVWDHVWIRVDGGAGNSTELAQIMLYEMFSTPPLAYLDYMHLSFCGDSIINFMGPYQSSLRAPFAAAQNLGIGGATMASFPGAGYIPGEVSSIPIGATHVLLEGGTNDLVGIPSDAGIIPGYTAMLNAIPSTTRVILIGIPPIDEAQLNITHPGWLSAMFDNAKIASMNAQINALATTYPNAVPATAVQAMDMTGKTVDGIHFASASVYQQWTALLTQLL